MFLRRVYISFASTHAQAYYSGTRQTLLFMPIRTKAALTTCSCCSFCAWHTTIVRDKPSTTRVLSVRFQLGGPCSLWSWCDTLCAGALLSGAGALTFYSHGAARVHHKLVHGVARVQHDTGTALRGCTTNWCTALRGCNMILAQRWCAGAPQTYVRRCVGAT